MDLASINTLTLSPPGFPLAHSVTAAWCSLLFHEHIMQASIWGVFTTILFPLNILQDILSIYFLTSFKSRPFLLVHYLKPPYTSLCPLFLALFFSLDIIIIYYATHFTYLFGYYMYYTQKIENNKQIKTTLSRRKKRNQLNRKQTTYGKNSQRQMLIPKRQECSEGLIKKRDIHYQYQERKRGYPYNSLDDTNVISIMNDIMPTNLKA